MTPKEEKEKIANLEKELAKVIEQRDGLAKRVAELESAKPASKSRQQALAALEMLKAGPVSQAQLKTLNDKYPSDPIYYVRSLLKLDVKTVRTAAGSVYMLPDQFATYTEGLAKQKAAEKASKEEIKEELPQTQAASHSEAVATIAA